MRAISLQSGSNGNCIYVEGGGASVLIDAGISATRARQRLDEHGIDIGRVDAVLISHDHGDHVNHAGAFNRKLGLSVYGTRGTLQAARNRLGRLSEAFCFRPGATLTFGGLSVTTIPTPHDGASCASFVLSAGGRSLGVLTDLGHAFSGLGGIISGLDAVIIESNYDPEMLRTGTYPERLKRRIAGPGGHISNLEAAMLLRDSGARLRWACLAHLSEHNNTPEIALGTMRHTVGGDLDITALSRERCCGPFIV